MDNFLNEIKSIQDQINILNDQLTEAQNKKIVAETNLQNEQQSLNALLHQLQEMTGMSDLQEAESYIVGKESELNNIIQDLKQVSGCINSNYTFTENDVNVLKGMIEKYNIPIGE